jgi:hypothetical protein
MRTQFSTTDRAREERARRKLASHGLILRKSRTGGISRRGGRLELLCHDLGGYMIKEGIRLEWGEDFSLTLDDVESYHLISD